MTSIVTPRRWENLAKYFFDISKLVTTTAVVAQLVAEKGPQIKIIAIGFLAGVLFLTMALFIDRKGDKND